MKNYRVNLFQIKEITIYLVLMLFFSACQSQEKYDPELMKPDKDDAGMIHGYNYTPLGALLAYPWEYQGELADTSDDTRVYSIRNEVSTLFKKDLVFEFQRNGELKFWFKRDYLVTPLDTITQLDGKKALRKKRLKSDQLAIKKVYLGSWKVNFIDSTILIDFGKNEFELTPLEGKCYILNAEEMCIIKSSASQIVNGDGKKRMFTRIRSCFAH